MGTYRHPTRYVLCAMAAATMSGLTGLAHGDMIELNLEALTRVHRVAIRQAPQEQIERLRRSLAADLPGVQVAPENEADLVIEYGERRVSSHIDADHSEEFEWRASLYRLDCQSTQFGVAPSRSSEGPCERHVFLRTNLGSMTGLSCTAGGGVDGFLAMLRGVITGTYLQRMPDPDCPALPVQSTPIQAAIPASPDVTYPVDHIVTDPNAPIGPVPNVTP